MDLFRDQMQEGGECAQSGAPGSTYKSSPPSGAPGFSSDPFRGRWAPLTTLEQAYPGRRIRAYQGPNKGRSGTVEGITERGTVQISWDDPSTTPRT